MLLGHLFRSSIPSLATVTPEGKAALFAALERGAWALDEELFSEAAEGTAPEAEWMDELAARAEVRSMVAASVRAADAASHGGTSSPSNR